MAATRLRKTFRFPEEEDSDDGVEGIDEEEQEKLIADIHRQDASKTEFYQKAFLALPILSLIIYLRPLFAPYSFSECMTAILSITSLVGSAYILSGIPLSPVTVPTPYGGNRRASVFELMTGDDGPVDRYLVYLNIALCGLLFVSSWASRTKLSGWEGYLPGLILGIVFLVRSQLAPIDVADLERLRYGYKGA